MTDLDDAADQLYGLSPAELDSFASRRGELVAAARAGGDRELAKQIGALKKPVLAAALANALVRDQPEEIAELGRLGGQLRDAHRNLRGEQLRELSEQRQRLLARLVKLSRGVAGRPVGESVLNQLRATYEAAIADEGAQAAVSSGRLTGTLSYSGFGEVDVSDAVAAPRRLALVPELPARAEADEDDEPEAADTEPSRAERHADQARQVAERAVKQAESELALAEAEQQQAAEQLAGANAAEQQLAERIQRLQAELVEARAAAVQAAKASAAAERDHGRAERGLHRAERAHRQAVAALDKLTD